MIRKRLHFDIFFFFVRSMKRKMLHIIFSALLCNYITITHLTSYPTLRRICVFIKSYKTTLIFCFTSRFRLTQTMFAQKQWLVTLFCTFFSFSNVWNVGCKRNIGQRQKCCNLVHQYGVDDVIEYSSMNLTEHS